MSVTKTTVEAYRVRANGEYAFIAVQGWQHPGAGGPYECGEISVHSSFGCWGHQWTNLGVPFKKFLMNTTFDYLMGTLLPGQVREFDFHASLASWKRHVTALRRARSINNDEYREIWDGSFRQDVCGPELFMHHLEESQPLSMMGHPLFDSLPAYMICRDNVQARGFWDQLWPEFIGQLRSEFTPANDALHPVAA